MEFLGLTINHKLKFDAHIDKLCKTASFKLHALRRVIKFLTPKQAKLLANSFANSQFGRTLCVVYDHYNSTYEELLTSHNGISIHKTHLKH